MADSDLQFMTARELAQREYCTPRPIEEYYQDMGDVLWWFIKDGRIQESPYVGSPLDLGFEVIIQSDVTVHIQTSETDESKDDPSFEFTMAQPKRFHVGGWPGYHTHFTPIPKPMEPSRG